MISDPALEPPEQLSQLICSHHTVKLAPPCRPDAADCHEKTEYLQSGEGKRIHDLFPRIRTDHLHKLKFASSETDECELMDANLLANLNCSHIYIEYGPFLAKILIPKHYKVEDLDY